MNMTGFANVESPCRTWTPRWILWILLLVSSAKAQNMTCGCNDCTTAILQNNANGLSCAERIETAMLVDGLNETQACSAVAALYPLICGPSCNPDKCDGQAPALCDCEACSEQVWNTVVDRFSCGTRIILDGSINPGPETAACQRIAEAYPAECGLCNPEMCPLVNATENPTMTNATAIPTLTNATASPTTVNTTASPTTTMAPTAPPSFALPKYCACYECEIVWESDADGFSCRERILYEQTLAGGSYTEEEACRRQSERYPYTCGPFCHPDKCDGQAPRYCGCPNCTLDVLNTMAGDFTCAQRIASLRLPSGGDFGELQACVIVASEFYECSAPVCNPLVCRAGNTSSTAPTMALSAAPTNTPSIEPSNMPTASPPPSFTRTQNPTVSIPFSVIPTSTPALSTAPATSPSSNGMTRVSWTGITGMATLALVFCFC